MQSFNIVFSIFVGVCLIGASVQVAAHHEEGHFELGVEQPHGSESLATVEKTENNMEKNQAGEKALLSLMAMKPLAIASGLLAGSMLPNKKKPNQSTAKPSENNVVVAIGNSNDVEKKEDDSRKLLLPLLAMKPLFLASMLAGNKLPSPGLGLTITKYESASQPPVTSTSAPQPTPQPTTSLPPFPPTPTPPTPPVQPPIGNTCPSLNGFPCYRLPSGCVCLISTQKPWVDALSYCASHGRKLISIQSEAKKQEIRTYLPFVIGTRPDDIFESIGFWTSGLYALTAYTWASIPQYFTFTDWLSGEPDNTNLPRATCVRAVPTSNYQWDDIDCGQFLPFLCE